MAKRGPKLGFAKQRQIRTVSTILRELFELANLTGCNDYALAAAVGVSSHTISNWRLGKQAPSIVDTELLALALDRELTLKERPW